MPRLISLTTPIAGGMADSPNSFVVLNAVKSSPQGWYDIHGHDRSIACACMDSSLRSEWQKMGSASFENTP